MRQLQLVLAALVAWVVAAVPAHAAWSKAETDQFVVYGDVNERVLSDYAQRLSLFDGVLRAVHELPPSTGRRKFQVYLVRSVDDLRRVRPGIEERVAGFYMAGPMATFAVAKVRGAQSFGGDDTLFHEYAHHFMLENFPAAYPAWFVEGWAEYYMTADVTPQAVKVGGYNEARGYWLLNSRWLPMEEVLGKAVWEIPADRRGLYYGQAWLLTHFMKSTAERSEQLNQITRAIAAGAEPVKAFRDATGWDADQLTRELKNYKRLQMMSFNIREGAAPTVTVTRLPPSADALLLDRLRILVSRSDPAFLASVREKAARYPGDAFAELTLANAEFAFGDVAAGEAIVKRRLATDPNDVETLILSGMGQVLAGQRDPAQRLARFRAARPDLAKAYQLDKTDYRPIFGYAYSRTVEPNFPTDNDVKAALEARSLAPALQDASLLAGQALTRNGRIEDARKVLARVANSPHGGRQAVQARALLAGRSEKAAESEAAVAPEEDPIGDPNEPPPEAPKPGAKPAKAGR